MKSFITSGPGIPLENVIRQNQLKMFQSQNLNYTTVVVVKKDQHSVCQYKNLMLPCYYTNTTDNINNLKNKSIIYNTETTVKLFISCSYHILIYSTLEFGHSDCNRVFINQFTRFWDQICGQ